MLFRRSHSPEQMRELDPRQPIGVYTGQPQLPSTPRVTLLERLFASLRGEPGIRLSNSTNRSGRYWGTDIVATPEYPTGPPDVNRGHHLELAPLQARGAHAPELMG